MLRRILLTGVLLVVAALAAGYLFARGAIGGDAVRRALEAQLTTRLGLPVRIASMNASFVPRVSVNLRDVTIGDPPEAAVSRIAFAAGLRALFSKRVEDAAIVIENGRIPAAMAAALGGAISGGVPADDPAGGFTIVSVRTLAFRNMELLAGGRSLVLDLESSLEGDRIDITRLDARSDRTTLHGRGTVTSLARHTGTFTLAAGELDLDELLAVVLPPSQDRAGAPGAGTTQLDVTIDLTAARGRIGGYVFDGLASTLRLTPGRLAAQPLRLGFFGGEYEGAIHMASSAAVPEVRLVGNVRRIDLQALLTAIGGSASMTGTLGGTLDVRGRGITAAEVLEGASGNGRIVVTDGVIPGLELVRSIVLAFGKPSGVPPAGSGSAFSRLAGTFALAGQVLRSDDFRLASRDFDLAGQVTLGLPAGAVDLRADVVLSRELTAQAGTDLRRYALEDGRVVVPVTIAGTVAAPRVGVDAAGVLNRALQNELKRRVRGLLDRIIK